MCAQLYIQKNAQPDTWVMSGAPTATTVFLSLAATIAYSADPSHPDTLPANTLALLPDGTSTSFDRTADVYVPYVVKGDATLRIIKESLLPTLTSDYAPLARVELHGIKPYQPEPYLASGGLGNQGGTTASFSQDATAKALTLWNGSSNNSPPAGWSTTGFDDSAWAPAVYDAALAEVWPESPHTPLSNTEGALFRQHVSLPAGTITGASLTFLADDDQDGIWINGTAIAGTTLTNMLSGGAVTVSVPPSVLLAGQDNLVAAWAANRSPSGAGDRYTLAVTYAGSGTTVATSGTPAAGDLLTYQGGAWTTLPAGTSGQQLQSTGSPAAPAWADNAGILFGTGAPSGGTGVPGQHYVDLGTGAVYVRS